MSVIHTIAMLCMVYGGNTESKDVAIRQHNCQKWYIQCLEDKKSDRGLTYDLKQCIKNR